MTGTGWYNVRDPGNARRARSDPDFTTEAATLGDPYGSMAYLSVVVPNRLNDGTSLPRVKVLAQGLKLPVYAADGRLAGEQFTNNPAWILLDILRRSGWAAGEIDMASFARGAAVLRRADRRAGHLRQRHYAAAVPVQPGAAEPEERGRRGARRPQLRRGFC